MAQTLANVRVSSTPVNTEPMEGKATRLCFIQLTRRGAEAEATNRLSTEGAYAWAALEQGNLDVMNITGLVEGQYAIFVNVYSNGATAPAEMDYSVYATTFLPKGEEATQIPLARLRRDFDDDRAAFRGDPRGPLNNLFDQIELRVEDAKDKETGEVNTWLVMYGIA
jgi:hypothetical protein